MSGKIMKGGDIGKIYEAELKPADEPKLQYFNPA
jgi:hypothetical protein